MDKLLIPLFLNKRRDGFSNLMVHSGIMWLTDIDWPILATQEFKAALCCELQWEKEDGTDFNWRPSEDECQRLCSQPGEPLEDAISRGKDVVMIRDESSKAQLLRITTGPRISAMTYKYSLLSILDHPSLGTPLCQCSPGTTIVRQCVGCKPWSRAISLDMQTSMKAKIRFLVFAIKIAEAVAYLHHSPIGPVLHNDLIDRNILVNFETGALMLIDFDMAIVLPNMGARVRAEKGTSSPNLERDLEGPVTEATHPHCTPPRAVLKLHDVYATYHWRTTHEDLQCHGIAVERDLFSLGQFYLTLFDGTQPLPVRWSSENVSFQLFEDSYRKARRRARWSLSALSTLTGFKRTLHNQFSLHDKSLAKLLLGLLGPLPRLSATHLVNSLRELLRSLFPYSESLLHFKHHYTKRLFPSHAASTTFASNCLAASVHVPRKIAKTMQFLPVQVDVPLDKTQGAIGSEPTGERFVKLALQLPRSTAECDVVVYRGRGSCSLDLRGRWGSISGREGGAARLFLLSPSVCSTMIRINLTEASAEHQGAITEEFSLWGPGVLRITADVHVSSGVTLHVVPGTIILLGEKVSIYVEGALRSVGSADDPVLFSVDGNAESWGAIRCKGGTVVLQHTIVSQGGVTGNPDYLHGHSNSEAVVWAEDGILSVASSAIIDCLGKAAGSRQSLVFMSGSLISRVDTGGEHFDSLVTFKFMHVVELPGAARELGEDDNDGLYLHLRPDNILEGPWWTSLPDRSFGTLYGSVALTANPWPVSLIESSVFIRGSDDAIDVCGGLVEIRDVESRLQKCGFCEAIFREHCSFGNTAWPHTHAHCTTATFSDVAACVMCGGGASSEEKGVRSGFHASGPSRCLRYLSLSDAAGNNPR